MVRFWFRFAVSALWALLYSGVAYAACPKHERIASIVRAWEEREPVRGLSAALSMADAECGRKRFVEQLELSYGVVGKGIPVEPTEKFAATLTGMHVVVTDQEGREIAQGTGAAILGHPLNAVLWLVEDLRKSGVRLKAGDVLSVGSFTPLLVPRAGTTVRVRYLGLPGDPEVSVRFK